MPADKYSQQIRWATVNLGRATVPVAFQGVSDHHTAGAGIGRKNMLANASCFYCCFTAISYNRDDMRKLQLSADADQRRAMLRK